MLMGSGHREARIQYMDSTFRLLRPATMCAAQSPGLRSARRAALLVGCRARRPYADAAASLEAERRAGTI
jgi:hypothetical protein